MSEQYVQAWAVASDMFDAIGKGERELVRIMLDSEREPDVRSAVGASFEARLVQLVDGTMTAPAYHNRRCATLLAEIGGTFLDGDVVLPGRGWQELAPMWQQWRHPELAALWSREPAWAQRPGLAGPWPRILCAEPDQLDALARDLRAFEPSDVLGNGIPDGVPRFSEGEWPLEPLADVIATLVEGMRAWVEAARALQLPLVAWLDGQQ